MAIIAPRKRFPTAIWLPLIAAALLDSCSTARYEAPPDGIWDEAGVYAEGLVAVREGSAWGYADLSGDDKIAPQFAEASPFSEGRAAVRLSERWGYIDASGTYLIKPYYEAALPYSDGLAAVKTAKGWGYIDDNGEALALPPYDEALSFGDGLAPVRIGQRWAFIDREGGYVRSFDYKAAGAFSENLAPAALFADDDEWGFVDRGGRFAIQPAFDGARSFSEGMAAVLLDGYWGFVDANGKLAINPRFEAVGDFSEGRAPAKLGGKWGLLDKRGEWWTDPRWRELSGYRDGWLRAEDESGLVSLLDEDEKRAPIKIDANRGRASAKTARTIRVEVRDYLTDAKIPGFALKEAIGEDGRYALDAVTDSDGIARVELRPETKEVFGRSPGYYEIPFDVSSGADNFVIKALSDAFELPRIEEVLLTRTDKEAKRSVNVLFEQEEYELMRHSSDRFEFKVFEGKFKGKIKKYFLQQGPKRLEFKDRSFDLDVAGNFSKDAIIHAGVVIDYLDTAIVTKTLLVVRDPAVLRNPIDGPPTFAMQIPDRQSQGQDQVLTGLSGWEFPPFLGGLKGGMNFLPANSPPMNFRVEYKDDKVMIAIGVTNWDEKKKGENWVRIKDAMQKITAAGNKAGQYAQNAAKSFGQQFKQNGSSMLSMTMGGLGYIELKWEKDQLRVVSGALVVFADASYNFTTYWYLGVPIYVSFTTGGKLSLQFKSAQPTPTSEFFHNVTFTIEPYVDLEAGVGVKGLLSIGIALYAGLPMTITSNPFNFAGNLVMDFFIRVRLLFIFTFEKKLARYSLNLWNTKSSGEGPPGDPSPGTESPFPEYSDEGFKARFGMENQDYVMRTRWVGDVPPPDYTIGEGPPIAHQPIKEGILPGSEPSLVLHAGREFAFWIDNSGGGRASSDRAALMFSARNADGSWPTGAILDDDGTADYEFSVVEHKGTLYAAWQNTTVAFGQDWERQGGTFDKKGPEICKNSEIKYAAFDDSSKRFGTASRIAPKPGYYHGRPRLASDGDLLLSFVVNTDNDYLVAKASGTFLENYLIPSNKEVGSFKPSNRLISYDAVVKDGKPYLVTLEDRDGDLATVDDRSVTIRCQERYNGHEIGDGSFRWSGRFSNPRVLRWKGKYALFCFASEPNGKGNYFYVEDLLSPSWYYNFDFNHPIWKHRTVFDGSAGVTEDFSLLKGPGDSMGLLFLDSTALGEKENKRLSSVPSCVIWDASQGKWSMVVKAWQKAPDPDRRAEAVQGLWHASDHIDLVYRSLPADAEGKEGQAPQTNLDLATIAIVPDLKIESDSVLRYFEPISIGKLLRFNVEVVNHGLATAHGLFTNLSENAGGDSWRGLGYDTAYRNVDLKPGERAIVPMAYRIQSYDGRTVPSFRVAVRSLANDAEMYTENNTAPVHLADPDLAYGDVRMSRDRYKRGFRVEVLNRSPVRIEEVFLALKCDGQDLVSPISIGTMAANSAYIGNIEIDIVKDLRWKDDYQKVLDFEISSKDVYAGAKRTENYIIINPYKYPPFSLAVFGAKVSGGHYVWVDAAATNVYPDTRSGSLVIEVLDERDQRVGEPRAVSLASVGPGETRIVSEIFRTEQPVNPGYKVRVSMPNSQKAAAGDAVAGGLADVGGDPEATEAPIAMPKRSRR